MKKIIKLITMAVFSVLACCMLVACVPSNLEKAEKKMEKEGYVVISIGDDNKDAEGVIGGFNATKAEGLLDVDTLFALLFDSKANAEAYYEDAKATLKDKGTVKHKGKWVYVGTEDAVEDFED